MDSSWKGKLPQNPDIGSIDCFSEAKYQYLRGVP